MMRFLSEDDPELGARKQALDGLIKMLDDRIGGLVPSSKRMKSEPHEMLDLTVSEKEIPPHSIMDHEMQVPDYDDTMEEDHDMMDNEHNMPEKFPPHDGVLNEEMLDHSTDGEDEPMELGDAVRDVMRDVDENPPMDVESPAVADALEHHMDDMLEDNIKYRPRENAPTERGKMIFMNKFAGTQEPPPPANPLGGKMVEQKEVIRKYKKR